MSDTVVVVGVFVISYGLIIAYSVYLYLRRRRASAPTTKVDRVEDGQSTSGRS